MKRILFIICIALIVRQGNSQVLYSNSATINLSTGSSLWVGGNAQIQSGSTITNNGTLTVTGNLENNATMSVYNAGTLVFNGSGVQVLSGSSVYYAKGVTVNNSAGITLNNTLRVDGATAFNNGVVNVADITKPIIFTSNATVSGASNSSHVNGYVVKEGTGNFVYPVGNGARYQQIAIDPTANATGIRVRYTASNAGSGTFAGATPLLYYNTLEYWDVTPISTATASVTIYWDNYNNVGIGNITDLRVAHKNGTSWLNEGGTGIGSISTGSVTSSGTISSWSPFTLGSMRTSSTLPVSWLVVAGNMNAQKQPVISWRVSEYNVSNYQIEKSGTGNIFESIATLTGQGNGENNYSYTEPTVLQNIAYYRIKQTDLDGKFTYSSIIKLSGQSNGVLTIYPTPFKESFTVISPVAQTARLLSIDGKLVKALQLKEGSNLINASELSKGVYILSTNNNPVQKIIKH